MDPEHFKKLLKEFAVQKPLRELSSSDVMPTGPDGQKITDPIIIKNLNMALKAVASSIRPKLIQMIEDPESAKDLKTPAQKAAVLGAIAIAFGITEEEFTQIIGRIKKVLPDVKTAAAQTSTEEA